MSIRAADSKEPLISCPYCCQLDYDWDGLKVHIELGWCEVYGKVKAK